MFVLSSIDRRISHVQLDPNREAEQGVRSTGFIQQLDTFDEANHSWVGLFYSRTFELLVFHCKNYPESTISFDLRSARKEITLTLLISLGSQGMLSYKFS